MGTVGLGALAVIWLLAAIFLFAFGHPIAGFICLVLMLVEASG